MRSWWAKLLCGLAAGFVIGRLFIIGHDACHQSLTPHRTLNKWLGRIAFLPSITPYSLWDVGHNVVHHGYTNLKGTDFVWAPLTQASLPAPEPQPTTAEPPLPQRLGAGPVLHGGNLVEAHVLSQPSPHADAPPVFLLDNLLVSGLDWLGSAPWRRQPWPPSSPSRWLLATGVWCPSCSGAP
jgi:omega-6 fatty acid desaturase (delta-12 desaturase)